MKFMKKQIVFFQLFMLLFCSSVQAIDANISFATFKGINQNNYIEIYLQVIANSIQVDKVESFYAAEVETTLLFKQGEEVITYDKSILSLPDKITKRIPDLSLIDMKRINLPNGKYQLEIILKDLKNASNVKTYTKEIVMEYGIEKTTISDIQLLENFISVDQTSKYVKHGFFLKPYTYNFYPSFVNHIAFFAEIYNTDVDLKNDYIMRFYIRKTGINNPPITGFMGVRKHQPKTVNPVLMQMDIAKLPTGIYDLVIEIFNNENQKISSKALKINRNHSEDFQLKNYEDADLENSFTQKLNLDELKMGIKSLSPILMDEEAGFMKLALDSKEENTYRKFLHHFWSQFNEITPESPYEKYMKKVAFANNNYGSAFDDGYETDRGYIYLKYGKPNDIVEQYNESIAPPYEVWFYNQLSSKQGITKFVFYNPSLAPNNFVLLHSNARSEIQNPQWLNELYKNMDPQSPKDAWDNNSFQEHVGGGQAKTIFDQY